MSKWEHVVENDINFWVSETIGTIMEIEKDKYVLMLPKVVKLGIFNSVEDAQQAIELNLGSFNKFVEEQVDKFNHDLCKLFYEGKKEEEKEVKEEK
jgi:hypothetical protein